MKRNLNEENLRNEIIYRLHKTNKTKKKRENYMTTR